MTATRPAFRKPWTHGARAYEEADSLEAMRAGLKRARKDRKVYITNRDEVAHLPCAACGIPLGDPYPVNKGSAHTSVDRHLAVDYSPRTGRIVPLHYYCSWGVLLTQVMAYSGA